jgi:diguanylate cyclase (GGDEF)-like protein/PAS domain S-box-containing protein
VKQQKHTMQRRECKKEAMNRHQAQPNPSSPHDASDVRTDPRAALETQAQMLRYQITFDALPLGVAFFDADERLQLSNRRFAEIYNLAADSIRPGATLNEIVALRVAAGTYTAAKVNDYLKFCADNKAGKQEVIWTAPLQDGRTIEVRHQPIPGGGWIAIHEDITQRKLDHNAANERLSLQALIDTLPDNLWVKDAKSRFIIANKVSATRMGIASPADLIGKTDLELLHAPGIAQKFYDDEQKVIHSGQAMTGIEEYVFDELGNKTWISTAKVPLRNERNEIFAVAGISHDITERKMAESLRIGQAEILEMIAMSAPLDKVLERIVKLLESQLKWASGAIQLIDESGTQLRHGAAPSMPKCYAKAMEGRHIGPNMGPCGIAAYERKTIVCHDVLTDPQWTHYKELARQVNVRSCWSTPILSSNGALIGTFAVYAKEPRTPTPAEARLIGIATHTAGIAIERKRAEDRIQFLATHDALTGLPNRALLEDRLSQAILHAKRDGRWVTVLFADIDNFKFVNDSLGHNAGDELLKTIAKRMHDCIRATDTVVRLGGDEFVIVLSDQPTNGEAVSQTVRKLQEAVSAPIRLEGHDVTITASLGIANYPEDGGDVDALLGNADAAMYRAKEIGRDNFQFYTPELNTKVHNKFLLQEELRGAVARSEFVLHYQPQVDLRNGQVFAVEALVRWNHPRLGLVTPLKFIPMAEDTGLIVPIGDWVLNEACRQNKAWQEAGLAPMAVCVNVSARQFKEKNLVARVAKALKQSGLDAKYLEIEVTESLIMQDLDLAIATMNDLQRLGVQLSIDDFGTGYSSLSALKTFPVSRLKIDKSFIDGLLANENDKAVTSAVISLGQKLNLRVIAEGVENDAQATMLRNINCDEMQGYLFSRPLPADGIEALLGKASQPTIS